MTSYKKGGGNKLQSYDIENGEYTDEEKNDLLNREIFNIVDRYYFGNVSGTCEPRFPILGFHNEEYCIYYVKHCVFFTSQNMDYQKISKYLLLPLDRNDKSKFFKIHGYALGNKEREDILYKSIMTKTDFSKMEFSKLNNYGILVTAPTTIYSYKKLENITIKTIWIYNKKDKTINFVTVNIGKEN